MMIDFNTQELGYMLGLVDNFFKEIDDKPVGIINIPYIANMRKLEKKLKKAEKEYFARK